MEDEKDIVLDYRGGRRKGRDSIVTLLNKEAKNKENHLGAKCGAKFLVVSKIKRLPITRKH